MKVVIISGVVFLSLFLSNKGFSQRTHFIPGYYINLDGDTTKGFISMKRETSVGTFQFYSEPNGDLSNVSFDSCILVSAGKEDYNIARVTRSLMYINKFDFTIVNQDSTATASIPLKLVYNSPRFSLYQYKSKEMENFFISDGGAMQELQIEYKYITAYEEMKYILNPPKFYTHPIYRSQIIMLMDNVPTKKQLAVVDNTTYDEKSLIRLLKALDQ